MSYRRVGTSRKPEKCTRCGRTVEHGVLLKAPDGAVRCFGEDCARKVRSEFQRGDRVSIFRKTTGRVTGSGVIGNNREPVKLVYLEDEHLKDKQGVSHSVVAVPERYLRKID